MRWQIAGREFGYYTWSGAWFIIQDYGRIDGVRMETRESCHSAPVPNGVWLCPDKVARQRDDGAECGRGARGQVLGGAHVSNRTCNFVGV